MRRVLVVVAVMLTLGAGACDEEPDPAIVTTKDGQVFDCWDQYWVDLDEGPAGVECSLRGGGSAFLDEYNVVSVEET